MSKFKVFCAFFRRMWSIDARYIFAVFAQKLVIALRTLFVMAIPKLLLDRLAQHVGFAGMLPLLALLAIIGLLLYFFESLCQRSIAIRQEKLTVTLEQLFSEKMMSLPYRYLEDPEYLELKEQAKMGFMVGSVERVVGSATNFLEHLFILIGLAVVLIALNPLLFAAISVLQVIVWFFLNRRATLFKKTLEGIVPINRKLNYFLSTIRDDKVQKDVRLYKMADMLADNIYKYNENLMEEFIRLDEKDAIYSSFIAVVNYLVSAGVFLYAGVRVISEAFAPKITIGDFSLYAAAAVNFSMHIREAISRIFDLNNQVHFIEPIETFMLLSDEQQSGTDVLDHLRTIEFKHVSFRYPGTERWILRDVSFAIKQGERISIVGLNGAGKSTLVKLLCRFFPVTEGEILINGKSIESYEIESYMNKLSAVFQDFQLLNFTLADNIIAEQNPPENARKKAMQLLDEVGMEEKIEHLPHGIDTYLGKQFHEDGSEMSGGQLQKIAIARALYKDADLIMLDEPTSALDPLAEAEIYEHFNELVEDKTAIYISHRMSSSVFCDRILLLNDGRIEAFDTHENLMRKSDSLYYKLFQTQAENYRLD